MAFVSPERVSFIQQRTGRSTLLGVSASHGTQNRARLGRRFGPLRLLGPPRAKRIEEPVKLVRLASPGRCPEGSLEIVSVSLARHAVVL